MNAIKEKEIIDLIPKNITSEGVIHVINRGRVKSTYLGILKNYIELTDELISNSLNISIRTYRNYKKKSITINPDLQERIILLLALAKHGKEIFGSSKEFSNWLTTKNFQLGKQPIDYLNTISGIKLVDDRLTGIEFGDNA